MQATVPLLHVCVGGCSQGHVMIRWLYLVWWLAELLGCRDCPALVYQGSLSCFSKLTGNISTGLHTCRLSVNWCIYTYKQTPACRYLLSEGKQYPSQYGVDVFKRRFPQFQFPKGEDGKIQETVDNSKVHESLVQSILIQSLLIAYKRFAHLNANR